MDIRQLHYFLVLCEEMNYTRAAQRLFLSRQALRQSISALEAELCGPLFLSAHHKLSLTDRGVSLQRHAAPVVEQFQQMQAALHAEIQSAQPVRIGISVSLVPDYLPGLETQLDKFRQQYPHIEMRFRLLDNDAVAEGVEQGELDAGLVMDLGCAAPVLARTTLRADPACLLVPRGHPFWEKESVPLAELRNQRVLLPSLRQDLFAPLWEACARAGFAPNAEIGPSFYQAYYLVQEQLCTCLTRYEPGARRELDRVRDVLLEDLPPLCVSMVQRRDHNSAYLDLLRGYLMEVIGGAASLPPRRGRPAKPFYNFRVLSSAAPKAAPQHPAPGTQLPFAGGNNFRELGGYRADEGKPVKWGQIYRGFPTGRLTTEADRARLDGLGLRLILDLRSGAEAAKLPDYVPDGARLVRICGLRDATGQEIDFSPNDIQRLVQSAPAGMSLTQLIYRQMLTGNKAFKELFRALEAGETPILFHCTAGKDRTDAAAALTDARKKLADLLASSGRPADALEPHFTCRLCEDTGIVDGRTCSCVHKVMQQLRRSEIEALSSLSISSFDTMELRYYPARMDASLGEPIRSYMSTLLDDLRGYADEFDTTSESLMLLGNAGLGKTHAALAIAGEVLEKGFDVIYVSSPDFFSKLEALHFGSDPAGEEEMLLRTAAGADLLILDDLGSEFNSSFLISTLYSLLNNRLGAKLPTIVTTNITDGALLEKLYTEKISSRLSSFVPFLFMGDDIRAQKAEEA